MKGLTSSLVLAVGVLVLLYVVFMYSVVLDPVLGNNVGVPLLDIYIGDDDGGNVCRAASHLDVASCLSDIGEYRRLPLLTIMVDSGGVSCPKKCAFVHHLLPHWVRYKYEAFGNIEDLPEHEHKISDHVLLVMRKRTAETGVWADEFRRRRGGSVGLLHMGDEYNQGSFYNGFDYVLRNYYWAEVNSDRPFYLRALGNLTCGTGPPWPEASPQPRSPVSGSPLALRPPPYGVHWMMLPVGFVTPGMLDIAERSGASVWPSSLRGIACSFKGNLHAGRGRMFDAFEERGKDLNCSINKSGKFGSGLNPWDYMNGLLAHSKIALCPFGNNPETHRLSEALVQGAVPASLDVPFVHAAFESIPMIVGETWDDVMDRMRSYLANVDELEELQLRGSLFYDKLQYCMRADMERILERVLGYDTSNKPCMYR